MTALKRGFTLIELLIVMAILGVLAVVVLVAINPAEQLRRARDSGRISGVNSIGRAVAAYFTANGCLPGTVFGSPCPSTAAWDQDLLTSEELNSIPVGITPVDAGDSYAGSEINEWWYVDDGTEFFVVYDALESDQKKNACAVGTTVAFAGFQSEAGRGGVWCDTAPLVTSDPPDY